MILYILPIANLQHYPFIPYHFISLFFHFCNISGKNNHEFDDQKTNNSVWFDILLKVFSIFACELSK